ncbi:MAG: polymer-forming cytoskeletal protein [Clostridium sp.]|nr:polymer-forming cytoskeletal protein [Clostridium sp.]
MFRKKSLGSKPEVFDTLIGKNTTLEGNVSTDGTIRIDGKINGDVKIKGDVFIGKDAEITGNMFAHNISVSGKVNGNIEAKGILKALSGSILHGDLLIKSLITEEGSIFEGNCKMISPPSESGAKKKNISEKIV